MAGLAIRGVEDLTACDSEYSGCGGCNQEGLAWTHVLFDSYTTFATAVHAGEIEEVKVRFVSIQILNRDRSLITCIHRSTQRHLQE